MTLEKGFASRSEIIRQAFRAFIVEDKSLIELEGEVLLTITIVYEKHAVHDKMFVTQHLYRDVISTFLHSHVYEDHCLEVVVAKGEAKIIEQLIDALKADDQINQVKIVVV